MINVKESVNDRVINAIFFLISSKKDINKGKLAEEFYISRPKFSEILSKRMNAGVDIMFHLVKKFDFNAEWLLTGEGTMLRHQRLEPVSPPPSSNEATSIYKELYREEKRNNELLNKQLGELENIIKTLQTTVPHKESIHSLVKYRTTAEV